MQILQELESLIPPLSNEEFKQLERNILEEGIREPLITWNGILIDGHNRYRIAMEHDMNYETLEKEFEDLNSVKIWMVNNQLGRRNLQDFVRGELFSVIEDILKQKGKDEKAKAGGDKKSLLSTIDKSDIKITEDRHNTQKIVAEKLGWSTGKKAMFDIVKTKAPEEIKEKLRTGEVSINQAYKEIKKEENEQLKTQKAIEIIKKVYENNTNIYNGNCIEYIKTIKDKSIDCLITDPPYGVDIQFGAYDNQLSRKIENDGNIEDALVLLDKMLLNVKSKLKDNAHIYIFCNWKIYPQFNSIITKHFQVKNLIIWDKLFMGMGDLKGNYSSSYEMIVFAGGNREFLNRPKNIIQCRFNDERFHNTQKPVDLIKQLIENSTNVNETIFDPFLGSGSTVVAAKEMKRNFIGCEIDEQNYKITLKRLENGK
jgi:DNA modification methylase/ParB-like chromosome segregation protein Spo0J